MQKKLFCVLEATNIHAITPLLEGLAFDITMETTSRRAMGRFKTWQPDVLLADFYKRYFHDRVSNLESLLAVATRYPATRIVVIHDPFYASDVELLKQRYRIDSILPLPLSAARLATAIGAEENGAHTK